MVTWTGINKERQVEVVDIVNKETRSRMMAGIRGKGTRPEMLVRRHLHSLGFRYRLHMETLSGKPDLVLPKWRAVIFVHGCFWHRHPDCKYATTPRSNQDFWMKKFEGNIMRDKRSAEQLVNQGWRVLVIWECALSKTEDINRTIQWLSAILKDEAWKGVLSWQNP